MAEISDLNVIDANNVGRWPEGMTFGAVDEAGQADEGILARWYADISGLNTTSGGPVVYSLTPSRAVPASIPDGFVISFVCNTANTGPAVLNLAGLGNKPLTRADFSNMQPGDMVSLGRYSFVYFAGAGLWQAISLLGNSIPGTAIPVGTVVPWATENIPANMLECNGQAVSRTTFSALFSTLGVRYGAGDGSTTFNVPDYRGYFLRGQDHGAGRDPEAGSRGGRADGTAGDNPGTTQLDAFKSHTHTNTSPVTDPGHTHNLAYAGSGVSFGGGANSPPIISVGSGGSTAVTVSAQTGISVTVTINNAGGTETRPLNINVRWLIIALPAAVIGTIGATPPTQILSAQAVNMNSVADTGFAVSLPLGFTRYRIQTLHIKHASTDLTAATAVQFGLFTAAAGGGTAAVAITTATVSSTAENTLNNAQFLSAINATFNVATLFFRVTTAHGSAATADVEIQIQPLL